MTGHRTLQLVARFSSDQGVDIEGRTEEFLRFAQILRGVDRRTDFELVVPADQTADPYAGFFSRLRLEHEEGRVRIYRDGETLRIKGSSSGLEELALFAMSLAPPASGHNPLARPGDHIHVEYYDGHEFLSQDSEPVVLTLA